MDSVKKLLLANKAWAQSKISLNPDFFKDMAKDQKPDYLWIGCSDSRVPPSEITGTDPGELFVHRNIANLVIPTDINVLGVMQYAIENLKVKHVIVCGHYNCGGVKAAMTHQSFGLLNHWIRNIKDTYHVNAVDFKRIENEADRVNHLVELNVLAQVQTIARSSIVQKAWKTMQTPAIHGLVYDLNNGLLKELKSVMPGSPVPPEYEFDY